MNLAHPVSKERAFKDLGGLRRRGRRLLVSAGIVALAFFFAILFTTYGLGRNQTLLLLVGADVITLGVAVPGLTLYVLRRYTNQSIKQGNPKAFTSRMKLGLVSVSWVAMVIIAAVTIVLQGT